MPAMPDSSTLRNRPAATMAAFGLVSGFLSAGWGQTYKKNTPVLDGATGWADIDPVRLRYRPLGSSIVGR